jgi:RHS repeat-associated protein
MKGRIFKSVAAALFALASHLAHAGTVTYVYTDPQGTPLAEADASGTITATFDYKPYGSQALGSSKAGPGYTGHVNDPDTGFVYMQARYYDPAVGRFLSVDPVSIIGAKVFTFGRYIYVSDNPEVNIDPDGRMSRPGQNWDFPDPTENSTLRYDREHSCAICFDSANSSSSEHENAYRRALEAQRSASYSSAGRAADAIGSTIFGMRFNAFKRPNHPTKVPDALAHELYMTGQAGGAFALSPYPMILGGLSGPVALSGAEYAYYSPFARGLLMGACIALACRYGYDDPDKFVEDQEMLMEIREGIEAEMTNAYRQIQQSGAK